MQHATHQEGDDKATSRPLLEQFLQSFLQERSIKWMLLIGAAIIVVCSLKLVAQQWEDWHLSIKFFSILGYIVTIFGFAEASNRLLGLKATSATLRGITLFLLPISFLSLGWLSSHQTITLWEWLPTAVVGVGVVSYISDSIFREFLSGRQITYQICFVLLGLIGSIPDSFSLPATAMAIAIWLTGTIGIIKINRYIYWLGEQNRAPKSGFQFFPVGLMGIEMLLLFSSKLRWVESQHWFGFALVLCAIPVAVTVQSLLQVHRVRTGGLLKTWPVSAGVTLVVCLLMASAGVLLSSNLLLQLGPDLKLLIPSSLLAAAIYFWAAYESKQPLLTSIGLGLVVVGYALSPVWFSDLARGVASTAASGLNESKLPIAFYGLTCLPLILGWSILAYLLKAKSLRIGHGDWSVFYVPLIWGANLLGLALLLFSASNTKAMFLIPACYVIYYIVQAAMWNDRRYMVGTLFAISAAIYSVVPFGNAMFGWSVQSSTSFSLLGVWCNLLFVVPMEVLLQRFSMPDVTARLLPVWKGRVAPLGQLFALFLLSFLSLALIPHALRVGGAGMTNTDWIWLALVLSGHALNTFVTCRYIAGAAHCIVWTFAIAVFFSRTDRNISEWMWLIAVVSTIGSSLGYLLTRNSQIGLVWSELVHLCETRSSREHHPFVRSGTWWDTLFVPARDWLSILAMACCGMQFVMLLDVHWNGDGRHFQLSLILIIAWLLGIIAVLRLPFSVVQFMLMAPLAVSGLALHMNWISSREEAFPLLWGLVVGALVLPISLWNRHAVDSKPWVKWLEYTGTGWCVFLLVLCCIPVVPLLAWAGVIALAVLYGVRQPSLGSTSFGIGAMACYYYAFVLICFGIRVNPLEILFATGWLQSRAYVAPFLSIFLFSLIAIQALLPHLDQRVARIWEGGLLLFIFKMTWISCVSTRVDIHWCLVAIALLLLLSGIEMAKAIRGRNESRVWICLGLLLGAIFLGTAKILFAEFAEYTPIGWTCLAISLAWCAQRSLSKDEWKLIARPFQIVAMGIASCLSVWFVMTHLFGIHEYGKSIATFCLFLASFYTAFEAYISKSSWSLWAVLVLLNAGLTSWTRTVGWNDLQLYLVPLGFSMVAMVELLRTNLTKSTAYNLRLTGSLVALVSPLAQIVQGSWWHLISLMVLSVLVVLLAIGLRIKVLIATGTAFLAVDLISILVRTAMDKPGGLWIAGLSIGVVVIALGALCEIYRDRIRARIRELSDELATWN